MIHLDYRAAKPIYAQIVEGYQEQIVAGVLESGEKLPSVRELAVQLSINPNTIQRAYRQLEAEGWIATVPGKGCFVCGLPAYTPEERQELLAAFDKTTAALLRAGFDRRDLIRRLQEEG
jgi:GntR family transcriptional regulator